MSNYNVRIMSSAAEISSRLHNVFVEVLEDPQFLMDPVTRMGDVESWDSFAHINLMLAIESEFGVEFDSDEIGTLLSIGDISRALHSRLEITGR